MSTNHVIQILRRVRQQALSLFHQSRDSLGDSLLRAKIRYARRLDPWRGPRTVQIEATGRCNLRCPSCVHATQDGGQHLTVPELRRFIDRLTRRPAEVILSGTGEPLLNPDFFKLIDLLAQRGIECKFYTNGTLLTADRADAILTRPNITYLAVSCDGATKETFEALRRGADFDVWKRHVGEFLAKVNARSPRPILVSTHTVVTQANFGALEDIIRLAAGMGFHRLHVIDAIPVGKNPETLILSDDQCAVLSQDRYKKLGQQLGMPVFFNLRRSDRRKRINCLQPWQYVQIKPGGEVFPCFAIFGDAQIQTMGNLHHQDFQSIWHGEPFRRFRKTRQEGTNPLCQVCPFA